MAESDSPSFGTDSPSVSTEIVPGWLLISPTPSMLSQSDHSSPETTKINNKSSRSGTVPSQSSGVSQSHADSAQSGCYMKVDMETTTQAELQHAENTINMKLGSSTTATIGYENQQLPHEDQAQSEGEHKVVHTNTTTTTIYSLRKRTSCQTANEEENFKRAFSDPGRLVRCEAVFQTPKKHKSFCQCPFEPKLDILGKCCSCRRVVAKVPAQAKESESDGYDSQDPWTPSDYSKFRKVIAPQSGKVKLAMKVNFELDSTHIKREDS